MKEFIIWAIPGETRLRVGALSADFCDLPSGAQIIARVPEDKLQEKLRNTKRMAKNGWSISRIQAACECQ